MSKIKQIFEKMREHTAKDHNLFAISIMVNTIIYIESTLFSVYLIKPKISAIDYPNVEILNFWIHFMILYPTIMKFFGLKISEIFGLSLINNFFKSLVKRN